MRTALSISLAAVASCVQASLESREYSMHVLQSTIEPETTRAAMSSPISRLPATSTISNIQNGFNPEKSPLFNHPGILLDSAQLSFISSQVAASADPWATGYSNMMSHSYASRTSPTPFATVECGSYSTPDIGCHEERDDALTAYLNALAWVVSGTATYADRAITFMNAWAGTIKAHNNTNAPLQAGWAAASWTRAAEIVRHTYSGWKNSDIDAFERMLQNVYFPVVIEGSHNNGNWELVMMEAALGISVFTEDSKNYTKAMNKFLKRTPAYIYLTSDGSLPRCVDHCLPNALKKYWYHPKIFNVSGLAQETCRDFTHVGYGFASISHVAEISRIQGRDLYTEDTGERLRNALEFHSKSATEGKAPEWLCNDEISTKLGPTLSEEGEWLIVHFVVTEVGYNALSYRLHYDMSETGKYTTDHRPQGTNKLFVGWETLTHAKNSAQALFNAK
ncbi:hypothetical protein BBP40_009597 [Aspergillus hancockii]|nr:hypothetical protein BBP40_009597 [Aspergillus hancockii]